MKRTKKTPVELTGYTAEAEAEARALLSKAAEREVALADAGGRVTFEIECGRQASKRKRWARVDRLGEKATIEFEWSARDRWEILLRDDGGAPTRRIRCNGSAVDTGVGVFSADGLLEYFDVDSALCDARTRLADWARAGVAPETNAQHRLNRLLWPYCDIVRWHLLPVCFWARFLGPRPAKRIEHLHDGKVSIRWWYPTLLAARYRNISHFVMDNLFGQRQYAAAIRDFSLQEQREACCLVLDGQERCLPVFTGQAEGEHPAQRSGEVWRDYVQDAAGHWIAGTRAARVLDDVFVTLSKVLSW